MTEVDQKSIKNEQNAEKKEEERVSHNDLPEDHAGIKLESRRPSSPVVMFAKMYTANRQYHGQESAFAMTLEQLGSSNGQANHLRSSKKRTSGRMRFVVSVLILLITMFEAVSRSVFNVAIVSMVDSSPRNVVSHEIPESMYGAHSCRAIMNKHEKTSSTEQLAFDDVAYDEVPVTETIVPSDFNDNNNHDEGQVLPLLLIPHQTEAGLISESSPLDVYGEGLQNNVSVTRLTRPTRAIDTSFNSDSGVIDYPQAKAIANNEFIFEKSRTDWSPPQQNWLLSAFYFGYVTAMLITGRLAEIYGSKVVIGVGIFGTALINLMTPLLVPINYWLVLMSRFLLGIVQSGLWPASYALFNQWLTEGEISIFASLLPTSFLVGVLMGSSAFIKPFPQWPTIDWPIMFYICGTLCTILGAAWYLLASSRMRDNRWISREELEWIESKRPRRAVDEFHKSTEGEKQTIGKNKSASWLRIVTSPTVIASMMSSFTLNFAKIFTLVQFPTLLARVHSLSAQEISQFLFWPSMWPILLLTAAGWLASKTIKNRGYLNMSRTTIRRIFQGGAHFGMASSLAIITLAPCNLLLLEVALNVAKIVSVLDAGGNNMLPFDVTDVYLPRIIALTNTCAAFSGIALGTLVSFVIEDDNTDVNRWNCVLLYISGLCALGGLLFITVAKAERIEFDTRPRAIHKDKDIEINNNEIDCQPNEVGTK